MCCDLTCDDAFYTAVTDDIPSLASFYGKYIISRSLIILHNNYSYLSWVLAYFVADILQISSHLMSKRNKEFLNEELKMTIKFEKRTIWFHLAIKPEKIDSMVTYKFCQPDQQEYYLKIITPNAFKALK